MATTEPEQQISLKLVVTKERNKVVFAEAEKDFVDVLISLLTLPLGTIIRLVREESNMQPIEVGSLTSLYRSVENPDKEFLSTDSCKQMILRPKNSMERCCKSLKLKIDDTKPTEYFACTNLDNCRFKSPVLISMFKNRRCRCGYMLDKPISLGSFSVFDGFVKDDDTFLITDDLKVVPNSLNAFFDLFKSCGVESPSSVNKMTVTVTKNQVMDLLKSCLISTATLTSVFLAKPSIEKYRKVEFPPFDVNENDSFKLNVNIVQRKSNGKIVFAQGKEDFVDFLLSLLTIPLRGVHENSFQGFKDVDFVDPKENSKNIVKGPTVYMVTDDLVVTPMTSTSVISLLATMSIPFSDLEEKEFSIGIKEVGK
ncbi:uncharacterized protein LOC106778997 [Vigna radiata var. radiata]|uniref:Uncharacterized protein LOC106778997 n=1 Tax=Vigna radiata var. radiata TaxID=3916 RepID=A0A1S3VW02_VIGRR|nr:uncharacterized protein LOC106778997 [Vigna radiata var. radiata]